MPRKSRTSRLTDHEHRAWTEKVGLPKAQLSGVKWVIVRPDKHKIAELLIDQAGGVQAAKDCITRVNKTRKKLHGGQPIDDAQALLIAAAIQKDDQCSPRSAMLQVVQMYVSDAGATLAMLRRLQSKIKGKTLAQFARDYWLEVQAQNGLPSKRVLFEWVRIPAASGDEGGHPIKVHARFALKGL